MSLAIVLGAGRGFGLEAARELGRRGRDLVITDVDEGHLASAVGSLRGDGLQCNGQLVDACDTAAMESFALSLELESHTLDAVVCVVGGSLGTPRWIDEINRGHVRSVLRLCTLSSLNALSAFGPSLKRARGGVLFVSSGAARIGDRLGWSPVYAFGKGVSLGLARFLASDPMWEGVRATAFCPGDVATERTSEIHSSGILTPEETATVHVARNPLGRMATPEEAGRAIADLVTNTFTSGAILDMNGGEYPTPA